MQPVTFIDHLTPPPFRSILNKILNSEGVQRLEIRSAELNGLSGHEAGRKLLETMYRERTGEVMPAVLVTDRGKPYFAHGQLHFSISHTKRRVFCALSERPVGLDAEELDRNIDLRLGEKILSPGEKQRYLRAQDPRLTLLRFWVLKEAWVKYTGQGLRGYPRDTDFSPDDPRVRVMDGCLVAVIEE